MAAEEIEENMFMKPRDIRKGWNVMKCWYREITGLQVYPNPDTINRIRLNYKKQVSQKEENNWYIDSNVITQYNISDNDPSREEIDRAIGNLRARSDLDQLESTISSIRSGEMNVMEWRTTTEAI